MRSSESSAERKEEAIDEVLEPARKVLAELEKGSGYQLQSKLRKRIEYFERNRSSEARLAPSRFWKRELDYLEGMAADMRSLRDVLPEHLDYPQWIDLLAALKTEIERYKARTYAAK